MTVGAIVSSSNGLGFTSRRFEKLRPSTCDYLPGVLTCLFSSTFSLFRICDILGVGRSFHMSLGGGFPGFVLLSTL